MRRRGGGMRYENWNGGECTCVGMMIRTPFTRCQATMLNENHIVEPSVVAGHFI